MLEKMLYSTVFEKKSPCPKMGHFYPNLFPKNLFALFLKSAVRIFFKTLHNEYGLTQSLDHTPPPKKEPKVLKEHFF